MSFRTIAVGAKALIKRPLHRLMAHPSVVAWQQDRELLRAIASIARKHGFAPFSSVGALLKTADPYVLMEFCSGSADVLSSLVDRGIDINARSPAGGTILHYLCGSYRGDIRPFLSAGIDLEVRDAHGYTALMHAVSTPPSYQGGISVPHGPWPDNLALLLNAGADPFVRANNGQTTLHEAVSFRNAQALQRLLDLGVDPALCDANGRTPHQLATEYHAFEVADILQVFEAGKARDALEAQLPQTAATGRSRRM